MFKCNCRKFVIENIFFLGNKNLFIDIIDENIYVGVIIINKFLCVSVILCLCCKG